MAYDEDLANRVREHLTGTRVTEKKMFGGLAFLVGGNPPCPRSSARSTRSQTAPV